MAANQDRRNQKTVWDILPALAMIGSILTAWVNLNGKLTQVEIQQTYNERITTLKMDEQQKTISAQQQAIVTLKERDRDIKEQLNDIERTVTHLYSKKRK